MLECLTLNLPYAYRNENCFSEFGGHHRKVAGLGVSNFILIVSSRECCGHCTVTHLCSLANMIAQPH